jgi:hypothetical protein
VDELDRGREHDVALAAITAHARCRQGEHRPQAFAASRNDMPGELGDERHRALHTLENEGIDERQIALKKRGQTVERRCRLGRIV